MNVLPSVKFDSAFTFVGLDFIARSLVLMEVNGTCISPASVAGNMTSEQQEILMARWAYHKDRVLLLQSNKHFSVY